MRVTAYVLVAVLSLGVAQDTTSRDRYDELNTIETKPSARLDPYIRKALLKALSDLEESATVTGSGSDLTGETTADVTNTDDYATETNKENIKIHSFVVNGQEAFAQTSNSSPLVVDKNISILSTTAGNVESHVSGTLPTQDPFPEILQTRESSSNLQQVRSIQSTPKYSSSNKNEVHKFSNFKPFRKLSTTTSTTTTTTTTTTPKPTHNADGENIEEVDKQGVQVYQAPLVAAFTVQQDENGIPKNVFPIYQQTNNNQDLKLAGTTNFVSSNLNNGQNNFLALQLSLQRELEEKQRVLEEQLRLLQLHQRQQEQILRQQQLLIQQKESQRQQQLFLEQEQLRLLEQQKITGNNILQSNVLNKPLPTNSPLPQNAQVSIQKSVSLDQNNIIPNQQQLPNREAVDFLIHLRNQQQNQFPLQENHLPQGIDNFLRPKPNLAFNQGPNINHLTGLNDLPQRQSNRVFRQENGVGNFGVNHQNFNRFNTFTPVNNNHYFPVNRPNQFNSDFELKQLLAQRGINGRGHEDLNIVSKVLSLNHGIPLNNVSNRLPFDNRRPVRTTL